MTEKLPHAVGVSRNLYYVPYITGSKKEGRAIPVQPGQALGVQGVSYSHISRQSVNEGSKVVSSKHRPPPSPGKNSWYPFLLQVGRNMRMKNCNDTIGNRTRDLPACSAVPRPTATPRVPYIKGLSLIFLTIIL